MSKLSFTATNVVIIGSGPAGIAAALVCLRAGWQTVIVSPAMKDTDMEAASESIHPGVLSLLGSLGAGEAVQASARATYNGILVAGKFEPLGKDESGEWTGHHIDRRLFDDKLLERARLQGVQVIEERVKEMIVEGERVAGVRTDRGNEIRSGFVIDCSGEKRLAGKSMKYSERFYSPPFFVWTGTAGWDNDGLYENSTPLFIPEKSGWTWLVPESRERFTWTRLSTVREDGKRAVCYKDHELTIRSSRACNRRWRLFRPLVNEGLLLCGDAAGILDPAAGQGILTALLSGIEAGTCVAKCLAHPDHESFYLAQYDSWFVVQYERKVKQLRAYYERLQVSLTATD